MTEQEKINRRRLKFAQKILPELPIKVRFEGSLFNCEITNGKICYKKGDWVLKEITSYDNYEAGVKMLRWLDKRKDVVPLKY